MGVCGISEGVSALSDGKMVVMLVKLQIEDSANNISHIRY